MSPTLENYVMQEDLIKFVEGDRERVIKQLNHLEDGSPYEIKVSINVSSQHINKFRANYPAVLREIESKRHELEVKIKRKVLCVGIKYSHTFSPSNSLGDLYTTEICAQFQEVATVDAVRLAPKTLADQPKT